MRKIMILLAVVLILSPIISAEITITNQPEELYNIGDVLKTEIKINALDSQEGFLNINLLCPEKETEVHKEYLTLSEGDEKKVETNIPLTKNFIGESIGKCNLKAELNKEAVNSDSFSISDKININLEDTEKTLEPEKEVIIEGDAKKENNENVEGFVEVKIKHKEKSEEFNIKDTVKRGYFRINHLLPEKTPAGDYNVEIEVYEKDSSGEITNNGKTQTSITVNQIPKSLEILLEEEKVTPGEAVKVKTKLHDQTGEEIPSNSIVTIKDSSNKIKTQETIKPDETLEFPIKYNEPTSSWSVVAISKKISSEKEFEITKNEEIDIEVINRTIILKNKGNIPYNKTVLIEIGNQTKSIETYLDVDEEKKYTLSAPNGEYEIKIQAGGEEKISESVMLTGSAISVSEVSGGIVGIARKPISWILMFLLLASITGIIIFRRKKKNFFEKAPVKVSEKPNKKEKKKTKEEEIKRKNSIIQDIENTAYISLSMQGKNHESEISCIKIKNINEVKNNLEGIQETVERIKKEAEKHKAFIYESQDSLFFLFSPRITKTFNNEKTVLELSKNLAEILEEHNKKFKQRIDYGIGIHRGEIISKHNLKSKTMSFTPKGNIINFLKKIAGLSQGEILASREFKEKAATIVKTENHESKEIEAYIIKEIKDKEEHKKFIDSFLKRHKEDFENS